MSKLNYKAAIIIVLKWVTLWLALGAIQNYILKPYLGLDGSNAFTSLFFLVCSILALYIYKVKSLFSHHETLKMQSLFVVLCTFFVVALGHVYNHFYPVDLAKVDYIKKELFSFPLFYTNTWVAKWSDVAYQQVMLVCVLTALNSVSITQKQRVLFSSTGFALLHFPLLILFGWRGLYFIVPSIFAGFVFTYLISYWRYGIFYSFAIHLSFYLGLGVLIRQFV
jgi:hypothetical protein